jgi:uncharacterized membrane protein YwaF
MIMQNISLFFTYETKLPADVGYSLYSPEHISAIAVSLLIIALIIVRFIVSKETVRLRIRRITAVIPVIMLVVRLSYVIICGASIVYELPLHLCSMTGIFCFIYEFCLKRSPYVRSVLGQAMYALCLPGAIMAILFPNGTIYPIIHYISFESYLFHSLIIAYICLRLIDKGIIPGLREAYKSILFLLIIVPPVYLFNVIFDTNFMFVIWPSSGSPLYGFYTAGGYMGYRIGFAFVAIAVIYLMNILYALLSAKASAH